MRLVTINRMINHLLKSRSSLLVYCKHPCPWSAAININIRHWCGTCQRQFTPAHQTPTLDRVLTSGPLQVVFQSRSNVTGIVQYGCIQPSRSLFMSASLDRCFSFTNKSLRIADLQRYENTVGSYNPKRYVGRSSRNQDDDVCSDRINITSTKYRLHDRTRILVKGRVSRLQTSLLSQKARLQTSLLSQKARLREKIKIQRIRGVQAVRHLENKFQVPREDVRTIPNLLTTMRMASAPVLAYLVVNESFGLACGLFIAAGITDMLDGYIARNFKNQMTALGMALDPLADKLLVSFLTISLTSVGLIPVPMTALILSRDIVLVAGSFYIRYTTLSPPRTLSRYFDVSHVTVRLHPSKISKVNTFIQLSFVASSLASPVFGFVEHPLLQALMYLTATTTVLSGVDYMLTWKQRLQIIKNK